MKVAVLACVLAACSDLQPVEPACGNGIIERGEDCDSGPNCRQCSIDCSTAACPDGYTCGPADQLCHAPGGRFHDPTAALAFPGLGFGVTDINKDGYGDVVALTGTSLAVMEGDAAGSLARQTSSVVPFLTGAPSVTHLDRDGSLDIVIPTVDGLVAYTSLFGVAAPYPFPVDISGSVMGGLGAPVMTIPLANQYLALIFAGPSVFTVAIIDGNSRDPAGGFPQTFPGATFPGAVCPGFTGGDFFAVSRTDVYDTGSSVVVAASGPPSAPLKPNLCVFEIQGRTYPFAINQIANLAANSIKIAIASRPILAALQLACPSVVDTVETVDLIPAGATEYGASGMPGACGLKGTTRTIALPMGQVVVGHLPLVPPVAGSGPDALAASGGIFAIPTPLMTGQSPPPIQLYGSSRPIATIRALDVDGDGDLDAVFGAAPFDDLDVLYRYTNPSGAGFLDVSVDTVGVPLNLVVGDFDGDGIGDITYTEKLGMGERLMVAFGSRDQVHAPVEVSRYSDILTSCPIDLVSSGDPTGTKVRDLVVVDRPGGTNLVLTVLYGSPQRTLLPFFDPRTASEKTPTSLFRGAIAGTFGATPNGFQDLVAIATDRTTTKLWLMEPNALGAMTVKANAVADTLAECMSQADLLAKPFCTTYAELVPWRAHPTDASEIVIGIDQTPNHNIAAFDPQQIGPSFQVNTIPLAGTMTTPGVVPEPGLRPINAYIADIDGDGLSELLVGYGPTDGSTQGHVVACTAVNLVIECHTLDVPDLAGWSCIDATPANVVEHQRFDALPDRTSTDLAVLCLQPGRAELFHVFHDEAGFHADPLLALPPSVTSIELADVTGDGIDDVLVVDHDPQNVVPILRVYPQCTSREVDSCASPAAVK